MLKKIKFYIVRLVFFLSIVAIGLMLTGSLTRDYEVLNVKETVNIGSKQFQAADMAAKYLPPVSIGKEVDLTRLEQINYEVAEHNENLIVNYYYQWTGQNHPNLFSNLGSKIWKAIYFKFALKDVEFIQVSVNKKTGNIEGMKVENFTSKSGENIPCIKVDSWDHEFSFCNSDETKTVHLEAPLVYFDDSHYASLKMARRSQGDLKTEDNVMNFPFIIFLALLATYYFRHLQKDYNNEYEDD